MTTGWWLVLLALAVTAAAAGGYWLRFEVELARRAGSGATIDFTRRSIGR